MKRNGFLFLESAARPVLAGCLMVGLSSPVWADSDAGAASIDSVGAEPMTLNAMRININTYSPDDSDNWDDDTGFQLQGLFDTTFLPADYTLGLSIGMTTWDTNNDSITLTGSNALSSRLMGDVRITQIGASVLRNHALPNNLNGELEMGLTYQSVSSDADLVYTYTGGGTETVSVDVDNTVALTLGGNIQHAINENVDFLFGAAYQFDIVSGDAEAGGVDVDSELGAFSIKVGLHINF